MRTLDVCLAVIICGDNGISSVLKSLKTQSDKITPKGKLNSLQERRGGEET